MKIGFSKSQKTPAMVKLHVINRLKPLCLFYQNIKFLWTLECSALMKNSTKIENKIIWMLKLIYYRESKYFTWRNSWKFTTVNNILHSKYLIIKLRRIFYQRRNFWGPQNLYVHGKCIKVSNGLLQSSLSSLEKNVARLIELYRECWPRKAFDMRVSIF